jgi:hypothetical protein
MTGGTAKIARRSATPTSQSSVKEIGTDREAVTEFSR